MDKLQIVLVCMSYQTNKETIAKLHKKRPTTLENEFFEKKAKILLIRNKQFQILGQRFQP